MKRFFFHILHFEFCFFYFVLGMFFIACGENSNDSDPKFSSSSEVESNTTFPVVLFFGDSLTAGLGLPSQDYSWPSLVENRLIKEGYKIRAINAGLSGDTTSGGLSRLDWTLQNKVDIFVLELGANDSMRGISVPLIKSNLKQIIHKVRERYPKCKILLVGMKTFPNLGFTYRNQFDRIYKEIAQEESVPLLPFILEGVAGERSLNQEDGIHPTVEGHKILAETAYPSIRKLL